MNKLFPRHPVFGFACGLAFTALLACPDAGRAQSKPHRNPAKHKSSKHDEQAWAYFPQLREPYQTATDSNKKVSFIQSLGFDRLTAASGSPSAAEAAAPPSGPTADGETGHSSPDKSPPPTGSAVQRSLPPAPQPVAPATGPDPSADPAQWLAPGGSVAGHNQAAEHSVRSTNRQYISSVMQEMDAACENPQCEVHGCRCATCGRNSKWHGRVSGCWTKRLKPRLQKSHWGYADLFEERPLGDAVITAMTGQIRHGSDDMLMLYDYDFYAVGADSAARLTPRGRLQLARFVDRMQSTGSPIKIQSAARRSALDTARLQHVVRELTSFGIDDAEHRVELARVKYKASAMEALQTTQGLQEMIQSRGRTIEPQDAAEFRGGAGIFNR